MLSWTLVLIAVVLVLGGLFAVLVIFSLSRDLNSAREGFEGETIHVCSILG
jgi:hypothetical protein